MFKKKVLTVLMVLAVILGLVACGNKGGVKTSKGDKSDVNLKILFERDDSLINTYSLIAVNGVAPFADTSGKAVTDVKINTVGADAFINWMLGEGSYLAKDYGYDKYGEYLFYILDNAPKSTAEIPKATQETRLIKMSTTTSIKESGLLEYLLPQFQEKYGYRVEVFSAGTEKTIVNAKAGNADVILIHSKSQEEKFIETGFARKVAGFDKERLTYMYNFFVLCGPKEDPAKVKNNVSVINAFRDIADGKFLFISRGDWSGIHAKELSLWPKNLGITDDPESFEKYKDWYVSSNAGMEDCLAQAAERGAYILSDKVTFLTFKANSGDIK